MRPTRLTLLSWLVCSALLTPALAGPQLPPRPAHLPRFAPPRPATTAADPAAQDLLRRMLQAENTLPLAGNQVTLVVRDGLDVSSEQRVQRNGARALRLDYVRPARLAGELVVDDGRFYCHFVPAKDTLELSPSRVQNLRVRVPQVIQSVRSGRLAVQQAGQDTVAGHLCIILQVTPRSGGPSQRFWVDPANGAQLRNEQYDSAGHLLSASYYTQIVYNPVFDKATFKLPAGGGKVVASGFSAPSLTLEQVRAQAGFTVLTPSILPPGFRLQGGSVSDRRAARVAELRYVSGAGVLSVFETPDRSGGGNERQARPQHPRRGILFGRRAGLKIVVIGNLSSAELDSVLASLR